MKFFKENGIFILAWLTGAICIAAFARAIDCTWLETLVGTGLYMAIAAGPLVATMKL